MTLTPGTRIGSYEIVSKLGEGGMGEVFRARDMKLGRDVAAKVLPASFAQDASRLARFEREARTLASLNHSNVAQVFGLEDGAVGADGTAHGPVLVMELLDGHSLADLLASGPLSVRKAVDYAGQIARGLAAAHDRGIIHRDLKPDNLFVLPDGRVKILDFGLARQIEPVAADASDPDATRVNDMRTEPGMVMGTVGYMAPEQVRAEATDARSDLFSLGLVLYEMLAGQRAFRRSTMAETMTAILREDPPDLAGLRPEANPGLIRVVHRLLEKRPSSRFQTGSDLAFALEQLSGSAPGSGAAIATPSAVAPATPPATSAAGTDRTARRNRSPWRPLGWVALGLVVAASSALFSQFLADDDQAAVTAPPAYRASVVLPEGVKISEIGVPAYRLAMSPDGTKVAFIGASRDEQRPPDRLWVLTLADGSVRELEGTLGARGPFWSPDSQQLGFFDRGAGVTKRVALSGGQATTIAPFTAGGAWAPDGSILLIEEPPGNRVVTTMASSATSPETALTGTDGKVVGFPVLLADHRRFLFAMAARAVNSPSAIYVGTRGGSAASAPRVIDRAEALNTRLANGYVLFTDGSVLLAQRFDQSSGTVSGSAVTLADDVSYARGSGGAFSASETGALVYAPKPFQSNSRLVWMDRSGKPLATLADTADYSNLLLSPDGRRAVTSVMDPVRRTRDIYIVDIERGVRQRLTFDPADERSAVWSADGRRIIYHKGGDLFSRASDFGGAESPVLSNGISKDPQQMSADGTRLLFRQSGGSNDLWQMSLIGEPKPAAVVNSTFDENYGNYSPDGRSMVYASNESSQPEVYLLSLDGSGGRTIVSSDGGSFPRWRRDGKEIVYLRPDQMLMAVSVSGSGTTFKTGTPTPLFRVAAQPGAGNPFDVSADGQHVLVNTMLPSRMPPSLTVIVNWPTLAAGLQQSPVR